MQLLRRRLEPTQARAQDVLVFAGPGAGKTLGPLLAFKAMQQEGRLQKFLVFCHRTSILSQWQSAAQRLGLKLQEWPCSGDADGLLITYQGAGRQLEQLQQELDTWSKKDPVIKFKNYLIKEKVIHEDKNKEFSNEYSKLIDDE